MRQETEGTMTNQQAWRPMSLDSSLDIVRGVLFDTDHTLVDLRSTVTAALKEAGKHHLPASFRDGSQ